MKKHIKRISLMIVCIILLLVGSFCIYYFSRFRTLSSIQKVTSYEDGYNLYQIDIKYDMIWIRSLTTESQTTKV